MQNYQALRSQIIVKAWKDPSFKERFKRHPEEVSNKYGRMQVPNNPSAIDGLTDLELILSADKSVDTNCFIDCTGHKGC